MRIRKLRTFVLIILAIVYVDTRLCAQNADCKSMLLNAAADMKKIRSDRFAMEYQVRIQKTNSTYQNSISASVFISGSKSRLVTNEMELFKDDSVQVTIMRNEKKIIITNPVMKQVKAIQQQALGMLQDSLLKWVTIVSCETICDKVHPELQSEKIDAELTDPRIAGNSGIRKITYWIDRQSRHINRILILYDHHPYDVKTLELIVSKFDPDYRGAAFQGDAYSSVFSNKKSLLPKYRGFEILDYRARN